MWVSGDPTTPSAVMFSSSRCHFKACCFVEMQIQISKDGSKLAGWKSVDRSTVIHLSWFLMGQQRISNLVHDCAPNLGFYKSVITTQRCHLLVQTLKSTLKHECRSLNLVLVHGHIWTEPITCTCDRNINLLCSPSHLDR